MMPSMTEFSAWKQSDPRTCGGAALMVALDQLGHPGLSKDREMEIWGYANNASSSLPGSFPGLLALYARRQGCHVKIFEDRAKLESIFRLSSVQNLFPGLDPVKALEEHDRYLREAEMQGIPVSRKSIALEEVVLLGAKGPVLMMVSTATDVSGLHWVLLQNFDPQTRRFTLMEPALGQNFMGPVEIYLHHYGSTHPFMGVAIHLWREGS
jgi:peptidase C3-like protein